MRGRLAGRMVGVALLALLATACSHTAQPQVRYTGTTPARARTRHAPADVAVLALGAPTRTHERAGMLEVRASRSKDADRQRMLAALRARAAEAGCDALVLVGPWYETVTEQPVYRRFVTKSRPIFRAACIVYRAPADREPSGDTPQ